MKSLSSGKPPHYRDPLFTADHLKMLGEAGTGSVRLPARSPNLNAYTERFVRTIKESCLDRMVLFWEAPLRKAVPGLWGIIIAWRKRLGELFNYYYRAA